MYNILFIKLNFIVYNFVKGNRETSGAKRDKRKYRRPMGH